MAQHAAPAPAHLPSVPALVLPLIAGIAYGFWAANIQRRGGDVTGGNIALGLVSGALVAALCFGIHAWSARQEGRHFFARAATWGVFSGAAIGFLHSLANGTVLWSVILGAIVGGSMYVATYYRYYSASEYAHVTE
ncbi:hypothetical protein [Streptomyces beihaiensis]|uniref:Integral membrane protein n=1 Tax=Streptomyces beihaiensis TaxID=2984495 RepID=A0ABT3TZ66_9ACTN|nr:hypothetical protein [Streptomyces beihaiensis]MCX3062324.1 hypothetical protein [Streptomyces beihaiensis]